MKLTPISEYIAPYSIKGKSNEEIAYEIQQKIAEAFINVNPKKREVIESFTLETSPLSLANNDIYLLGIIIMNIKEQFNITERIKDFTESKVFPTMEDLIGFVYHQVTK